MNEVTPPSSSASQGESSSYAIRAVDKRIAKHSIPIVGRLARLRLFFSAFFKRRPKWRVLLNDKGNWIVEERNFFGDWDYRGLGFSYDGAVLRMKEIQEARVAPKQVFYFD
jgi:predicted DNA-binding helix-hairpin-helix protein